MARGEAWRNNFDPFAKSSPRLRQDFAKTSPRLCQYFAKGLSWLLVSTLTCFVLIVVVVPVLLQSAFRHLPPNSARFSYATEGVVFISAHLSTDAVSALRKVWVLTKLQALVYDILPLEEGAGKRCSECGY